MLHSVCEKKQARLPWIRALFLFAVFFIPSCSPASFELGNVSAYPIALYDAIHDEITYFLALAVNIESGDSDISYINLVRSDGDVSWELNLQENWEDNGRRPQAEDQWVAPDSFSDESGAEETLRFPWFAFPGKPLGGQYEATFRDASYHQELVRFQFDQPEGREIRLIEEEIPTLNPQAIQVPGSWELIFVSAIDGSILERSIYPSEEVFPSQDAESAQDGFVYIWGVPRDSDIIVLAGPYLP